VNKELGEDYDLRDIWQRAYMFIKENVIEDLCTDEAGNLMKALHEIETWTKSKRAIFDSLIKLLQKNDHIYFRGHPDKYHLSVIGSSCFYNIPLNRRGHLSVYRGKLVRLVCVGSGRYDREYMAIVNS
jgi:hypothetical protein